MDGFLVTVRCKTDDVVIRIDETKADAYKFLQPICYSSSGYTRCNEYVSTSLEDFIGRQLPSIPDSIVIQEFKNGKLLYSNIEHYFFFNY